MKKLSDLLYELLIHAPDGVVVLWPDQLNEMTISFDKNDCSNFVINGLELKAHKFFFHESRTEPRGYYCAISTSTFLPDVFLDVDAFYPDEGLIIFIKPDLHTTLDVNFTRIDG